ncbi:sensor domain-containing diguanylate cyclase [Vibrio sp. THAF190c]|uniref:GGDEF domain-containing protein n=1 Tax=Vibrio sp. THAF190c TaxID=2587865 RepID=UPI0012678D98|nr:sensor domain-containing diguanylate cyclase [Vibrio sp. THAF190c]QFT12907.1 Response regulator PleD [Vibrio sp. THAF190c]
MFNSKLVNRLDCSLLEQLGYLVAVYDQQWRSVYSCEKMADLLAINVADSSNRSLNDFVDSQDWLVLKESATLNDGEAHDVKLPLLDIKLRIRSTTKELSNNTFYIFSSEILTIDSVTKKLPEINESVILDVDKHLKLGYWRYAINNNSLLWSEGIYQIHGLSPDNFTPTLDSALSFYHEDDLPIIKSLVNDAIAKKKSWHAVTLRIVTPDGGVRWVLSSGCFYQLADNKDSFICGVFEDVTEQQRVSSEHNFLVTALKETSVGMVVADHDKNVIWVNKSFERITGYSLIEVAGNKLGNILQGEGTDPEVVEEISEFLQKGMAIKTRIKNYHKSGRSYWNELSITPITKGSKVDYYFAVQNDVTNEVNAKLELQNLNHDLEAQVEARTIELKIINQKLSEQANIDPLTGLLNRRPLNGYIAEAQIALNDGNQPLSYILIDIDDFKNLNDKFGHSVGDLALEKVAEALIENSRKEDKVFRLGGEEFLVLMKAANTSVALTVSERMRLAIASTPIFVGDDLINITASFGVLTDGRGLSVEESLRLADKCLYQAKASGKNRVVSEVRNP